ncbi:M20/M25/M40 family metallo-hydrolase [Streptomyces sp. NPDC091406]|uniref:M20/M25/M40 family metallo-hydrolase n=1 Tax=unclassified Streptomyces TaxID=2593676 RepID=UPI0038146F6C
MSALGEVASTRSAALYVVKLGSASQQYGTVFDELLELRRRGARILLVAGGAVGIEKHYRHIGRTVRTVTMRGGDTVRYCPPDEMPHVVAAYEQLTLPAIEAGLGKRGLSVFAVTANKGGLVRARPSRPLRVTEEGRSRLIHDHRAGVVDEVDAQRLDSLLSVFDVVCLAPPVAATDGGTPLNVDADVLAAEVACALDADHLRLVTGTSGLLTDPDVPDSTLRHAVAGEGLQYAAGRMRQKVRAAEIGLKGTCDVAVTGPHTLSTAGGTWFWRAPAPAPELTLLSRAVELSSVSRDEHEIAHFLSQWCAERGIEAVIDAAGNLVATRGSGSKRLLLLGHLDTVPHRWPVGWGDGDILTGRGSVDAKASLVSYLEMLAEIDVPQDVQIRVVGAVQEEITGDGAFFARDHYPADAVIVGEPSGAKALTIGYYGLVKARLSTREQTEHTAGKDVRTAGDRMVEVLRRIREDVAKLDPEAMVAVLGIDARNEGNVQAGEAVVDVRVPPQLEVEELLRTLREATADPVRLEVLRATPGVATPRSSSLVKSFQRAFRATGTARPRFVMKKGSSDMNTLATTWHGIPMVAYGPGDSKLDHTPHEHISAAEFREARSVLDEAVQEWIRMTDDSSDLRPAASGSVA